LGCWSDGYIESVSVPLPTSIIGVDKELVIFRMGAEHAMELRLKLFALGPNISKSFDQKFIKYAVSIPIGVKYCSMSGLYCKIRNDETAEPCLLRD
jgi:hypothetical protein